MIGQHLNDRIWLVNTNPIIAPGWSNNHDDRNWLLEPVLGSGVCDILLRIRMRIGRPKNIRIRMGIRNTGTFTSFQR